MAENFGIANQTYFCSKNEILLWINSTLHTNYKKIEEFGKGFVYCQLFNHYFPNNNFFRKVIKNPISINDFHSNFKILQKWFNHLNIDKYIEVEKLMKCKLLDNLEFIQWAKKYLENKCNLSMNNSNSKGMRNRNSIVKSPNIKKNKLITKINDIINSKDSDKLKISYIKSLIQINNDNNSNLNSNLAILNTTHDKFKTSKLDLNDQSNQNSNVKSGFIQFETFDISKEDFENKLVTMNSNMINNNEYNPNNDNSINNSYLNN